MTRKKSKKSFSTNLESLFEHRMYEDNAKDNPVMFSSEEGEDKVEAVKEIAVPKRKGVKKAKSKKSFSTNLERFFKESIEGVMDGVVTDVKRNVIRNGEQKAIGIDLLIQRTTKKAPAIQPAKPDKTATQRLTFVLDATKISELKRIAKTRNQRIRQIMVELIEDFLGEFDPEDFFK